MNNKKDISKINVAGTGFDCKARCEDTDDPLPLCTAATEPYFDLDTHYQDSIFSPDPAENPAFFDYNIGRTKQIQFVDPLPFSLCSLL